MSSNAIEKALWKALSDVEEMRRYREDQQSYLKRFNLDDEERSLLLSWDLPKILSRDVSALLLLSAFTAIHGAMRMPEYVATVNGPRKAA